MFWDANTKKHQLLSTENLAQYQLNYTGSRWSLQHPEVFTEIPEIIQFGQNLCAQYKGRGCNNIQTKSGDAFYFLWF